MADWIRRKRKETHKPKVHVYYWDAKTGKQQWVARAKLKHLDSASDSEVQEWFDNWVEEHGIEIEKVEKAHLRESDRVVKLFKSYQKHRKQIRSLGDKVISDEHGYFWNHIGVFFVNEKKCKNYKHWKKHLPEFLPWLMKRSPGDSLDQTKKILWTLERFGKYLCFHNHLEKNWVLEIPSRNRVNITPLKTALTPKDVIAYAKSRMNPEEHPLTLAVLLGYFAALAPAETFALCLTDFVTGKAAKEKADTSSGLSKHGLGSKLTIRINKSYPSNGHPESLPKNDFRYGFVNVWDKEAAVLIATLLKNWGDWAQKNTGRRGKPNPDRLYKLSRSTYDHWWAKTVKKDLNVTAHDLRRAACLYLGRTLRLEPTLVQEIARHSNLETTLLYCRKPTSEDANDFLVDSQDFDDVA